MKLLLTMDVLVPVLMKNAANRDKWNELQNSVNHQMFECKWHFGVTPRSMSVWVSVFTTYNISMFHRSLFIGGLVECEQENCLIASKLIKQAFELQEITCHHPWWEERVLYCLKRMMLHKNRKKREYHFLCWWQRAQEENRFFPIGVLV